MYNVWKAYQIGRSYKLAYYSNCSNTILVVAYCYYILLSFEKTVVMLKGLHKEKEPLCMSWVILPVIALAYWNNVLSFISCVPVQDREMGRSSCLQNASQLHMLIEVCCTGSKLVKKVNPHSQIYFAMHSPVEEQHAASSVAVRAWSCWANMSSSFHKHLNSTALNRIKVFSNTCTENKKIWKQLCTQRKRCIMRNTCSTTCTLHENSESIFKSLHSLNPIHPAQWPTQRKQHKNKLIYLI